MATAESFTQELELERFKRYGIDQAQMRIACSIIVDVLLRPEHERIRTSTLAASLSLYPIADFHADREQFKRVP